MFFKYKASIILSVFLLSFVCSDTNGHSEDNGFGDNHVDLSDDEISYALSELSVDDLNTLNKLMDVLSEEGGIGDENYFDDQDMSDKLSRYKRDSSRSSVKDDQNNILSNVDEGYIRQLDDSFPNVMGQQNQEEKDKAHIRVKRD